MTTQAKIAQMRKVAFYVGVARYLHTHGDEPALQKCASEVGKLATLAAIGVPVLSYLGGRHVGRFAGGLYGNASTPSAVTMKQREYDLAAASTQRLIDELNADRVNKIVNTTIAEVEEEKAPKKSTPFASPSLLRYGR